MSDEWKMIDGDVSWQHSGRPAYWEDDEVYCSECQVMLWTAAVYVIAEGSVVVAVMQGVVDDELK